MKRQLAKFILFLIGWKIKGKFPSHIKKCVIIAAPHTSNQDFFIGRLGFYIMRLNVHFLIKQEAFKFPFGGILRNSGGIPTDRSRNNNMINKIVSLFDKNDSFYLAITPEGTRKRTNNWKKGFYFIAQKANVPIALVYVDYKKKEGGFGPIVEISENLEADMKTIYDFYRTITPKFPDQFNLSNPQEVVQKDEDIRKLKNQYCCKR